MNKSYYVRLTAKNGPTSHVCCCGRCGKRVLADNYNIQEHERTCNLKTGDLQAADSQARSTDEIAMVEEKNSLGYLLESNENVDSTYGALTLSICIPILKRIPGYTNRYSGMEWMPVFVAVFAAGTMFADFSRALSVTSLALATDLEAAEAYSLLGTVVGTPVTKELVTAS